MQTNAVAEATASRYMEKRKAGRPPGSKSRPKRALIQLLNEQWPDYQPVIKMAEHAMKLSEIAEQFPNDPTAQTDAVNAHEKVAKYVTPQLKAMDITSGGEQIQFGFQINLANLA